MKNFLNLFTIIITICIVGCLFTILSCNGHKPEIVTTTEIKLAVTYTNGDVDTLTTKWTGPITSDVRCYLESGEHQACLCITADGYFGRTTLACGVRKYKELSRRAKIVD
jgi:hypothetical protein